MALSSSTAALPDCKTAYLFPAGLRLGPFTVIMRLFKKIYIFSFLLFRGFAVTLLFGKTNSEKHLEKCEHSYLPPTPTGIAKVNSASLLNKITSVHTSLERN